MSRRSENAAKVQREGERRMMAEERARKRELDRPGGLDVSPLVCEDPLREVLVILGVLRMALPDCMLDGNHCHECLSRIVDQSAKMLCRCDDLLSMLESGVDGCPEGAPVGVETG